MNWKGMSARVLNRRVRCGLAAAVAATASMASVGQMHSNALVNDVVGCVAAQVTLPDTCSYTSLGSDRMELVFEGTAGSTASISGCGGTSGPFTPSTNPQPITGETGGSLCTVSIIGSGVAVVTDDNPFLAAPCVGFGTGTPGTPSCTYTAVSPLGVAAAELVDASQVSAGITVRDLTLGTVLDTCASNNFGNDTVVCAGYSQHVGDQIQVAFTATGGTAWVFAGGH